jgi:hypothetical protein
VCRAHDADEVQNQQSQLVPVVRDHDLFVGVLDLALVLASRISEGPSLGGLETVKQPTAVAYGLKA